MLHPRVRARVVGPRKACPVTVRDRMTPPRFRLKLSRSTAETSPPSWRRTVHWKPKTKWISLPGSPGPIVELATEEGKLVKKGQLLVRIDERETAAQVEKWPE